MANTLDLHFSDTSGRRHVLRVVPMDGCDWHLHVMMHGRAFSKHCSSWQGVERSLMWLRRHAHESLELCPCANDVLIEHGFAATDIPRDAADWPTGSATLQNVLTS